MNITTKTEKITFGEKKVLGIFKKEIKFIVKADIPDDMLKDYSEVAKFSSDINDPAEQVKAYNVMKNIIRGILYMCNKKKAVDKFVNSLGIKGTNKIFVFLNEYINEVDAEKKNE